ncbi:MAG: Transcription termination factor Rho, partial [Acidimicrobiaceae bacterium]|nr:Transcription termination factor Rho [Acidimicrobiaceae bacterium]
MAGEQLERSILERKERDELHAIAAAMSLAPRPRSKKADIIDLILRATGAVPDEAEPAAGAAQLNGSGHEPSNGTGRSNGNGRTAASRARAEEAAVEAPEPAEAGEAVEAAPPGPRRRSSAAPRRNAPRTVATAAAEAVEATTEVGSSSSDDSSDEGSGVPVSGNGNSTGNGAGGSGASRNGFSGSRAPRGEATGNTSTVTDTPGSEGNEQGGRNGRGAPGQVHSGGQPEAGNRRSRRRRGRDRGGEVQGGQGPQEQSWQGELVPVKGLLDLREEGYGFLRTSGYLASQKDVYVSVSQARRFALRKGDAIEGACRPAGASEKYPALIRIDSVSGMTPDEARQRPRFEDLTPLFPDETLRLELPGDPANLTARIVDLISPVGKGQRGLIVSPPKAGKTTVMKQIAHSIEANNPDVHLIVLLVDERPEEVTDMRRSVKGEVIASTFDRPA